MIESREIKMANNKMLAILYMQSGIWWTIAAFIGLAACIVLGFAVDYRFFILALIWIFLFIPLVVAFLYFFYGMQPLTAFNCVPHKIFFEKDHLAIRVCRLKDNPEIQSVEETEEEQSKEENKKDFIAPFSLFKEIKSGADYMILIFHKDGWLWLPIYAFDSVDEFKAVIEGFGNGKI